MDSQLQAVVGNIVAELSDAFVHLAVIFGFFHSAQERHGILLQRGLLIAKEYATSCLRLKEEIVDIDAYKDAYLFYVVQLLTQFEITAGTKIANYGMKDVEVGHCCGDAVELVHQRRLDIVEEFGAHKAWRVVRFAFQSITNKKP